MGLYYAKNIVYQMLGSKVISTPTGNAEPSFAITAAALTTAYSGNTSSAFSVGGMSQAVLNVQYKANGNGSLLNLKVEFSGDDARSTPVNWFQEVGESSTTTTNTEFLMERKFDNNGASVSGTTYSLRIPVAIAEKYMRISAKETVGGGGTAGTIYVELVASGK